MELQKGTRAIEMLLRVTHTDPLAAPLLPPGLSPTFFPSTPTNRVIIAKEKNTRQNIQKMKG